jgi:RNA polymerase sigma-70 factor, ECF subfamily
LSLFDASPKGDIRVKTEVTYPAQRMSDLELVRKAQEGNADAFAVLYNAHKAKVYSLCLRMTSNTAEAEDLTQAAFLQVFRKLGSFRGDSALSTWLYRVAVNTVLMHFRKKGVRPVSLDEPVSQAPDAQKREIGRVDGNLSGTVDRIALTRAMKELPAGYRRIFVLHEVEGYEHNEIARRLRCSVGTSKSQLHKAKARMRELLGLEAMKKPLALKTRTAARRAEAPVYAFNQLPEPELWASEAAA